jgi:hypothetical protein
MIKQLLIGSLLSLCVATLGCKHGLRNFTAVNHKVIISTTGGTCTIDQNQKSITMHKKADSHGNLDTIKWCSATSATYQLMSFSPSIPLTPLTLPASIDQNCTKPAHVKDDQATGTYSYVVQDANNSPCDPNVVVK